MVFYKKKSFLFAFIMATCPYFLVNLHAKMSYIIIIYWKKMQYLTIFSIIPAYFTVKLYLQVNSKCYLFYKYFQNFVIFLKQEINVFFCVSDKCGWTVTCDRKFHFQQILLVSVGQIWSLLLVSTLRLPQLFKKLFCLRTCLKTVCWVQQNGKFETCQIWDILYTILTEISCWIQRCQLFLNQTKIDWDITVLL
jgi:hypothetical protein